MEISPLRRLGSLLLGAAILGFLAPAAAVHAGAVSLSDAQIDMTPEIT